MFHDETVHLRTDKGDGEHKLRERSLNEVRALSRLVDLAESVLTLDEVFERRHANGRKWLLDVNESGIVAKVLEWVEGKFDMLVAGDQGQSLPLSGDCHIRLLDA